MGVAVNDKLTGNMLLVLPDGTFFHADCQLTVTGTGTNYGATGMAETAGATGATGAAAGQHNTKK